MTDALLSDFSAGRKLQGAGVGGVGFMAVLSLGLTDCNREPPGDAGGPGERTHPHVIAE